MLLGRLVEDLGPSMLEVVVAPQGLDVEIADLVVHEPSDRSEVKEGDLVLALGIDVADGLRLVESMGALRAGALIAKPPVVLDDSLARAASRAGVAVISLARGASWSNVIGLVRSMLTHGNFGLADEQVAGVVAGDLFALANAIAAVVDGPITIEDAHSRILAYSARQDEADSARTETILGRQVPERYMKAMREAGVFRRLAESLSPIFMPDIPDASPRVAIAVRAGDEVLGSIWAVVTEPLDERRTEALVDSAKLVALHMLRHRAGADVERRLRADLLATVLEGRAGVIEAAARLGLEGQAFRVVATTVGEVDDHDQEAWRGRLWDALALHLSAVSSHAATTLIGDVIYAVLPTPADAEKSRARARKTAEDFLARSGVRAGRVLVGIGGGAAKVTDIPRSRLEADQALRVLRSNPGSRQVADIEDTHMQAVLLRLADLMEGEAALRGGRLGELMAHDAENRTDYAATLEAYLEAFGDIPTASVMLHVHPNTFRYRLKRLQEISDIDLHDARERFDLQLQLRLLRLVTE